MTRGARLFRRVPADRRNEEGGYVLVLIAGSMTVLLAIAGFAVDLGFWYRESTRMQSAVDAAALAGVVYMPGNFAKAQSTALTTMAKNGFADGANGVAVTVSSVAGNSRRLKVCARDTQVERFFSKVVGANPIVSKCATSEYVLPVAMGSPLNEMSSSTLGGVWPAVNGACSATEDGDEILSKDRGMFPDHTWTTYTGCKPGNQFGAPLDSNPTYDPLGYNYIVNVKSAAATAIEVYDGEWSGSSSLDGVQGNGTTIVDTTFKVTWDRNTPLDQSDDQVLATVTIPSGSATYLSQWKTLATANGIGRYTVNVTVSTAAASHGSNSFGLRGRVGATFSLCSSDVTAGNYSATCPEVFAEAHLGVNAQTASSVASFYLASVDSIYAGRQMTIGLFDPGEGGSTIEVLDPNGTPVSFTYQTIDDLPTTAGALAYSGSGTALPVSGTVTQPTNRRNPYKFNDRKVQLVVDLPANYVAKYGTKTWWKLRYTFGTGSVGDRTTWDVAISGDPVHLVLGG